MSVLKETEMTEPIAGATAAPPAPPAPSVPTDAVLNSATMIIGLSGSGKSTLLATTAEYVWETYQKVSLYNSCDGGGFPTRMQALINLGIVRLFRMRTRSAIGLAHETCQRAAQGYWPQRINPKTGETSPNVKMIPPMTVRQEVRCAEGHPVTVVEYDAQFTNRLCPTCKMLVTRENRKVTKTATRTKGFESVGAVLLDGLSSMLSWGMDDLSERTARQELVGEKSGLGGTFQSGDLAFTGSNRAQYGFMQKRAESLLLASNSIPGLVIPAVWTALTQEGIDEGRLSIVGPQLVGQAKTAEAGQWAGDTVEAAVVEMEDGKKYRRLYLQQYIDARGARHLCCVRSTGLPAYLEDEDASGLPELVNFNMGAFYKLREAARVKAETEMIAKYRVTPGVVDGLVEVGEESATPAMAATPPGPSAPPPAVRPAARPLPAAAVPGKVTPAAPATPAPQAAKPIPAGTPVIAAPPAPKPPALGPTAAAPPGRRPVPPTVPPATS